MIAGVLEPGKHVLDEPLELKSGDYLVAKYPGTVVIQAAPGKKMHGIVPSGDVLVSGVRFEAFDWAVNLAHSGGPVGELTIENCQFRSCQRAINGWQDEQNMTKGPPIEYLTLRKNRFIRCGSQPVDAKRNMPIMVTNRFNGMLVEDNEWWDCASPGIMVGDNNEKWQDEWKDAVIRRNLFVRQWAETQAVGIQIYGIGHLIEYNELSFVFTLTNKAPNTAEGIYGKLRHSVIRHNLLLNAGGYEASICSKGATDGGTEAGVDSGYNRIYGNEVWHTGRVPFRAHNVSIMLRADAKTKVFDNLVDGTILLKQSAVNAGSFAVGNRTPTQLPQGFGEWEEFELSPADVVILPDDPVDPELPVESPAA